jgi:hypothetical protein
MLVHAFANSYSSLLKARVASTLIRETHTTSKDHKLAKPNYSGEKRRKDLARKARKEEKRLRKLEAKQNPPSENADAPDPARDPQVTSL